MSLFARIMYFGLTLGVVGTVNGAEYMQVDCMMVDKDVSGDISYKLGYGIEKQNKDGTSSVNLISGNKAVGAICSNTVGKKLLSVDKVDASSGDSYIVFNLESDTGCKFSVDIMNTGEGLSLRNNYSDTCEEKVKKASEPSLPYSAGDRVYAVFESGKKCKATVLVPGNDQSKIEYNEWCETGFISSKSKGEKEWAPNHAQSSR